MRASCLTPQEIEQALKQSGINPTAQRIAICRYVLCEADHPTAEEVKHWVDQNFPKLSLATVYNTLKILVEVGLLHEVRLPNSDSVRYDHNVEPHHHFLDDRTGELVDIPADQVKLEPKLGQQFQVDSVQLLLRGRRVS
jgi:Fur family iron response transcriptional regulator